MQHRVLACEHNLAIYKKDHSTLRRTLSIDESWVSLYMEVTAKVVKEFLAEKKIMLWKQPPYSSDISLLDYGCFAELKRKLRGRQFSDWDEFKTHLDAAV